MGSPQKAAAFLSPSAFSRPPPPHGTITASQEPALPPMGYMLLPVPCARPPSMQALNPRGAAAEATMVAPPHLFFPPSPFWRPQILRPPHGNPITQTALRQQMLMQFYTAPEVQGRPLPEEKKNNHSPADKAEGSPVNPGSGGKGSSAPVENPPGCAADSVKKRSLEIRDDDYEWKELSTYRKRRYDSIAVEGEVSHPVAAGHRNGVNAESSYNVGEQSAKALPVPVSESRRALSPPVSDTDLDLGMDLWKASNAGTVPLRDKGELSRRRNREAAKRLRLRKKKQHEESTRRMDELIEENNKLREEMNKLREKLTERMLECFRKHGGSGTGGHSSASRAFFRT